MNGREKLNNCKKILLKYLSEYQTSSNPEEVIIHRILSLFKTIEKTKEYKEALFCADMIQDVLDIAIRPVGNLSQASVIVDKRRINIFLESLRTHYGNENLAV